VSVNITSKNGLNTGYFLSFTFNSAEFDYRLGHDNRAGLASNTDF